MYEKYSSYNICANLFHDKFRESLGSVYGSVLTDMIQAWMIVGQHIFPTLKIKTNNSDV